MNNDAKLALFNEIAREALSIPTLKIQNRDRLDFHDVSVWSVLEALDKAYEAGSSAQCD